MASNFHYVSVLSGGRNSYSVVILKSGKLLVSFLLVPPFYRDKKMMDPPLISGGAKCAAVCDSVSSTICADLHLVSQCLGACGVSTSIASNLFGSRPEPPVHLPVSVQ